MGVGDGLYLALIHGTSLWVHSSQPFPGRFGSHCLQGAIYVLTYHAAFSDELIAPPALFLVGGADELAIGADIVDLFISKGVISPARLLGTASTSTATTIEPNKFCFLVIISLSYLMLSVRTHQIRSFIFRDKRRVYDVSLTSIFSGYLCSISDVSPLKFFIAFPIPAIS